VTITRDRYGHVTDESIRAMTAKLDDYYERGSA
jgi:hypothetical protein